MNNIIIEKFENFVSQLDKTLGDSEVDKLVNFDKFDYFSSCMLMLKHSKPEKIPVFELKTYKKSLVYLIEIEKKIKHNPLLATSTDELKNLIVFKIKNLQEAVDSNFESKNDSKKPSIT